MSEEEDDDAKAAKAARDARKARRQEIFYFTHVPALMASVFLLDFETFTKLSLLYTTTVSAITAAATYGAKRKASESEVAGREHP